MVFVIGLLVFLADACLAQCAMCKATVESSQHNHDAHQQVGRGLNGGILMLLAIPYFLLMFLLWYFFRNKIKGFFKSMLNIYPDAK